MCHKRCPSISHQPAYPCTRRVTTTNLKLNQRMGASSEGADIAGAGGGSGAGSSRGGGGGNCVMI